METQEDWPSAEERRAALAGVSLVVGSVTSGIAFLLSLQGFFVARGAMVRPMGFSFLVCLLALIAFLIGVPSGIAGLYSPRRRRAALGIVLSLAPFVIGVGTIHLAAAIKGFHFLP